MRSIRTFPVLFLFFSLASCKGQNQTGHLPTNKDDNTLLWEISGKDLKSPSYLFGTFHLMCSEDIRFSSSLKAAVKETSETWLELDLDDPATLFGAVKLMNMKEGKKLSDLYEPDAYKRLDQFFRDSLKTSLVIFQQMKPAFLEAMLYPKMLPCKKVNAVEEELMVLAKANKKEIRGLETMAFQASVFDSIPYPEQAKELLKGIDSINSYRKYFDTMVNIYKSQQLGEIEKMFSKSEFGMEENRDILLNKRNRNWVELLRPILKDRSVFIAVGAGHLVGEEGLIALLKKEGYVLRPIENKKPTN
ncbi:MAG: TraB/GumN family protein [Chitinophagaceae bacterium]|nr:TraB/GumN family protein [Chitinophagaceae bacterium]MBL0056782.1 TraB/GumN family protein [Chitinophagaceae bacterium]